MYNKKNINIVHNEKFGTDNFSIYYYIGKNRISPWYDIPYKNKDGTYNAVIEIPRWTR